MAIGVHIDLDRINPLLANDMSRGKVSAPFGALTKRIRMELRKKFTGKYGRVTSYCSIAAGNIEAGHFHWKYRNTCITPPGTGVRVTPAVEAGYIRATHTPTPPLIVSPPWRVLIAFKFQPRPK